MLYKKHKKSYRKVSQTKDYDCIVACLAMFTGEEYEIIYSMLQMAGWKEDAKLGVNDNLIYKILKDFGYQPVRSFQVHPIPSIVIVPSLNKRAGLHAVFFDGDSTVYDPMYGMKFKNTYDPDYPLGEVAVKSITCERFFEGGLRWDNGHTLPWRGFETPRDVEMEGLVGRMIRNKNQWDEREKPLDNLFKWQIEEAEKILEERACQKSITI